VIAAAVTAVTAIVSAAVPLVLLGLQLNARDVRTAEGLVRAIEAGIVRERAEEPTLEDAARECLKESALDGVRMEVWGPTGLVAAKGPGAELGPGSDRAGGAVVRRAGRLIARGRGPSGLLVAVAVPLSFSQEVRREMSYALLLAVLPLSVVAALLSVRLARRALAPLESLATEVGHRRSSDPWKPFDDTSQDVEVARLTHALNEMGQRMTQALAAEREFAAYAAHALRTPLTRLVAESRRGAPPADGALETLRGLVESLLVLLRSDARFHETGSAVNLADIVRHVAVTHAGGSHVLTVEAPDEVLVRGDEELLLAAVEHLAENALTYSPPGSTILLSSSQGADAATVVVQDDGPGVGADELDRIFEPFVRGRTGQGSTGSGLGLALVRRIAVGHGGSARAVRSGAVTRFEVTLPAWKPR